MESKQILRRRGKFLDMEGVRGSIPLPPTIEINGLAFPLIDPAQVSPKKHAQKQSRCSQWLSAAPRTWAAFGSGCRRERNAPLRITELTLPRRGYVLVDVRRIWKRRHRCRLSASRHRPSRRCAHFWPHRRDHGLCDRPYFRMPPQPGGDRGIDGGRPLSRRGSHSLRHRLSHRRHRGCAFALCHCQGRSGF